jgi:hypothetical protein
MEQHLGRAGFGVTLGAVGIALVVPLRLLPRGLSTAAGPANGVTRVNWLATSVLFLATTVAWLLYGGTYAFAESKAVEVGMSSSVLGATLSFSTLLAIPGSILASLLGTRYTRTIPLVAVMLVAGAAYYLILGATRPAGLLAGLVTYGCMQMFLTTYIYGSGAALDPNGRVAAALTGYSLIPYALGSGVFGSLSHGDRLTVLAGPVVLVQLVAILIIVPVALWLDLAKRRQNRLSAATAVVEA